MFRLCDNSVEKVRLFAPEALTKDLKTGLVVIRNRATYSVHIRERAAPRASRGAGARGSGHNPTQQQSLVSVAPPQQIHRLLS